MLTVRAESRPDGPPKRRILGAPRIAGPGGVAPNLYTSSGQIQTERHADRRVGPLPLKLSALALADRSGQIDGPAQKVSNSRWYGYAVGHWGEIRLSSTRTTLMTPLGSTNMAPRTAVILNITDHKTYVGTWKGDKKIFQLVEKPASPEFTICPRTSVHFLK
jgi:hypothetical protein